MKPASKFKVKLSPELEKVLLPAYAPYPEFNRACSEMRWYPSAGHVPRGFLGATRKLSEVELVLVSAEPGDPCDGDNYEQVAKLFELLPKSSGNI
jgi:hypothetical protein